MEVGGNNRSVMPLDVLGRTRATLTKPARIPSKRMSSACVDYVPALCTHRPSLLPIEWLSEAFGEPIGCWQQCFTGSKFYELGHLEEVKVVTRFP
ncbi:uncharacterized protein MELLADRAFT_94735 [Melampsora larici-populina 98AG31]|uniref:Uncharacterized protein n=1 Tax=Melampsora larici-populina (strain 98AG31 / pathotype 3-4-7) TaxID=747676 RepID=F4S7R6_MELLP|nr:uncharacterized protein MELLADRAFT_94735 [Melampsora larici-populina 98AG31]EGF99260.1 hypothetical protein MELLADRAFT_94735 [Melampsora larici-populina 98AG31]